MKLRQEVETAYQKAIKARLNSHSPYSHFKVGSCVKFRKHDQLYAGCNVENVSFGATVCAERVAIFSGVADHGHDFLDFVVVVTDTEPAIPPCALCLQVFAEMSDAKTEIYIANLKGIQQKKLFHELLALPFVEFPQK